MNEWLLVFSFFTLVFRVVDGFVFCLMMGIDSGGNDYNKYD